MSSSVRNCAGRLLFAALYFLLAARPGWAASVGVGSDYYAGPQGQTVRDLLGYAETVWRHADVTFAGALFSNSQVGSGGSGTLAVGYPVWKGASLQLLGSRAVGENNYRGSRFQAGPVFPLGGGGTLGISYTRAEDTISPSTQGVTSELGLPVSPSFIALARGSLASVEGGGTNLQGSAGFIWSPRNRVLLLSELAFGRDAVLLPSGATSASGGIGIVGRESGTGRDYVSGPAFLVGMRYVIH